MKRLSLCVYCGSRFGALPAYEAAAREVGREIARRGWRLVYGGGNVGLMGAVADAALQQGAEVVGVIPESLLRKEVGHRGVTELLVVQTMHQRKQAMAERSDAFLALPGGIGTLEELYEMWSWRHLGYHAKPIGVLNTAGFYDELLGFMRSAHAQGFVSDEQMTGIAVEADPGALLDRLAAQAQPSAGSDYSKT